MFLARDSRVHRGTGRHHLAIMNALRYDSTKPTTWTSFFRRIKNTIAAKGAIPDDQKKGIILEALDDATLERLERWL